MTVAVHNQPCRICGHPTSHVARILHYPEHGYRGPFILRRCDQCRVLFNSPRLDDHQLADLYTRNYYFFNRTDAFGLARTVPMYHRTIAPISDQLTDKRVLDVGCGRGYFPALLNALGYRAAGIEISPDAADYARRDFTLDIFTGTLEQYTQARQANQISVAPWPLITAIDVVEHVSDPAAFLAAAASLLAPGGRLVIDTPNADAQSINVLRDQWPGFNPFHIYLFTPSSLQIAAQRTGLVVEEIVSYSNQPAQQLHTQRLRAVLWRALKVLHLAAPATRPFFGLRRWLMPRTPPPQALAAAALAARQNSPSLATDSRMPLAAARTGDNLLLLARKPA